MASINNSDSVIIILHEIYGINQHIMKVCQHFSKAGFNVICPDLINLSEPFEYDQEEEAYQYFLNNVGFELASQKVQHLITQAKEKYKHVFLLGFSIGATIAWLCSGEEPICEGIIGYYGSRIRDYLSINPKCPVLLIFANEEKSFGVEKLACTLGKKSNVEVHMLAGKHGFSDPFSKRYHEQSSEDAMKFIKNFLKQNFPMKKDFS